MAAPVVRSGDEAPPFTLAGTGGREYSLADYRGRTVILAFYPGDNTPVCTEQLTTYTTQFGTIRRSGADLLAISPQSVESHEDFARAQGGFAFPLLADTDLAVSQAYGVVGPLGVIKRSIFVVDAAGIIRYAHRSRTGLSFQRTSELVAAVRAAG